MIISCAGDCGLDIYVDRELARPGGISLNVAVNAKKCFPATDIIQLFSVIGDEDDSKVIDETIKKFAIQNFIVKKQGRTPTQYISTKASGEKDFLKYEAGVLQDYRLSDGMHHKIGESDYIITVIFEQMETFFRSILNSKGKGKMIVDFMNLGDYGGKSNIVAEYIDHLDMGFFGLNPKDIELIQDLTTLSAAKKKLFIITLGASGSIAIDNGKRIEVPAYPLDQAKVVDTTGAGDAFIASFLSKYVYTHDVEASMKFGNEYAAKIVQQIGSF